MRLYPIVLLDFTSKEHCDGNAYGAAPFAGHVQLHGTGQIQGVSAEEARYVRRKVLLMVKGMLHDRQAEALLVRFTWHESERHYNALKPEGGSGSGWYADNFKEILGEDFQKFPLDVIQVLQHWFEQRRDTWGYELVYTQHATAMKNETCLRVVRRH